MYDINEINGIGQFLGLRNIWNSVLDRCSDRNVFLTWEYLSTCWRHSGNGKKLRILTIKDKDEIIAIAPLKQSRYTFGHLLGYNVIEPLGYRDADYTGLLLAETETDCLKLFLNYLAEHDDWDFTYMYDLPQTSRIPKLLSKLSKDIHLSFDLQQGAICPYLSIPYSMDLLLKELNGRFRKNLRRSINNLRKDCGRLEFKKCEDFGSVENAMAVFFKLHQKRWRSKQMAGAFAAQEGRNFHTDIAKQFANKGWFAMYFLMVNDEPIAASYNYSYDHKMYFVLGGFDPVYSRYSIGHIVLQKAIEDCIQNGITEYDFLKGDEPYKWAWTKEYRQNLGYRFVSNRFTSNLLGWGMKKIKQAKLDRIVANYLEF